MAIKNSHIQRHLRENASECLKHNVRVHVERIDLKKRVAFCTVQQLHVGALRRYRSNDELVWRAEQALSPLLDLGISPLITVRQPGKAAPTAKALDHRQWSFAAILHLLGWPLVHKSFTPLPTVRDPFGWRQALRADRSA